MKGATHITNVEEQALELRELVLRDAEETDAVVGLRAGCLGVRLVGVAREVQEGRAGVGDAGVLLEDDGVAVLDRLVDAPVVRGRGGLGDRAGKDCQRDNGSRIGEETYVYLMSPVCLESSTPPQMSSPFWSSSLVVGWK